MLVIKKISIYFFLFVVCSMGHSSCKKKDYPCPGLGQSNEADLSLFDEEGNLKSGNKAKRRVNKSTGMVNKKNPKKLKAPRKKHI